MKRILICGATGFIGKNLLDFYSKNKKYKIRATHFKRPALSEYEDVEWVQCDLRDPQQVSSILRCGHRDAVRCHHNWCKRYCF